MKYGKSVPFKLSQSAPAAHLAAWSALQPTYDNELENTNTFENGSVRPERRCYKPALSSAMTVILGLCGTFRFSGVSRPSSTCFEEARHKRQRFRKRSKRLQTWKSYLASSQYYVTGLRRRIIRSQAKSYNVRRLHPEIWFNGYHQNTYQPSDKTTTQQVFSTSDTSYLPHQLHYDPSQ